MKCFACDKPLKGNPAMVDTRDDQIVRVGPDCFRKVQAAGEVGYKPLGDYIGPRLYLIKS